MYFCRIVNQTPVTNVFQNLDIPYVNDHTPYINSHDPALTTTTFLHDNSAVIHPVCPRIIRRRPLSMHSDTSQDFSTPTSRTRRTAVVRTTSVSLNSSLA